jgi:hypothetical protein
VKYSVSIRQPNKIKKLADEIMVNYNDMSAIYDLLIEIPDKEIVLKLNRSDAIEWKKIQDLNEVCNLTLALEDLRMIPMCKDMKYYWSYPITSFYELNGVIDMGVSQVLIGGSLYFDLISVAKKNIPIRVVANMCFDNYIPREEGICGTYIRPDDVELYDQYITTIEFFAEKLEKEAALLEIYQKKEWKGNLNLVLTNFKFDVDNRGIPKEFANARIQCRQRCQREGTCHFCYTAMKFSRKLDEKKEKWSSGIGFSNQ